MLHDYEDEGVCHWFFQDRRRRLVEDEMVERFPEFYVVTPQTRLLTVSLMQSPIGDMRPSEGIYSINWRSAFSFFAPMESGSSWERK